MPIESRLRKAEKAIGAAGECSCWPRRLAVYYEDEPRPSGPCPDCGGERPILHVVFESAPLKYLSDSARPASNRLREHLEQHSEPVV